MLLLWRARGAPVYQVTNLVGIRVRIRDQDQITNVGPDKAQGEGRDECQESV